MTIRLTRKTVLVEQPFRLGGCVQVLQPGVYLVETDERLLDGASYLTYEPIETFIHLHGTEGRPGVDRALKVSTDDLDAAVNLSHTVRKLQIGAPSAGRRGASPDRDAMDRADDDGMAQRI